jgi:pimeloyl-ACP methyl ester carboxylesterase
MSNMSQSRARWKRITAVVVLMMTAVVAAFYFRPIESGMLMTRLELRLQGEKSHDIILDGYRIHYREMGSGKPLVLVHGLGGNSLDWAPVMKTYAKAGYHVYAPDLLGFGKSEKPDVAYSIAQQVKLVDAFMQSQGIQQADVIGWSMGGWIALKFTLEHPDKVRRLVVNDSAGLVFHAGFGPEVFVPKNEQDVKALYTLLEPKASPMPSFVARDLTRRMKTNGWVIQRAVNSMLTMQDLLDGKLGGIKQPVLIVWGADDNLIPVSSGYDMAKAMPQSDLEIFEGCGHLAPAKCAPQISSKTLEFLEADNPPHGMKQQLAAN